MYILCIFMLVIYNLVANSYDYIRTRFDTMSMHAFLKVACNSMCTYILAYASYPQAVQFWYSFIKHV